MRFIGAPTTIRVADRASANAFSATGPFSTATRSLALRTGLTTGVPLSKETEDSVTIPHARRAVIVTGWAGLPDECWLEDSGASSLPAEERRGERATVGPRASRSATAVPSLRGGGGLADIVWASNHRLDEARRTPCCCALCALSSVRRNSASQNSAPR